MKQKTGFRLLQIVGTAVLLGYVVYKAGLFSSQGWEQLFEIFSHINLPYLLAALAIGLFLNLISTIKWYMLLKSRGLPAGLWRLFAYYMVGQFFNLLLPTSLGGDVVRMQMLGRYTGRYADSAASVFVERFTGMATLFLLVFIAMILNIQMFNLPWLTVGFVLFTLAAVVLIWLILDERPLKLLQRHLGTRIELLGKFFAKAEKFRHAVIIYKADPSALWIAFLNSLIFYFFAVVNVWLTAHAFGSYLTFLTMVVAVPVILLILNLPISIGGIGLSEFAYTFTLGVFGASPAIAVSIALFMRLTSLLYAAIGGLVYPVISDGKTIGELKLQTEQNKK